MLQLAAVTSCAVTAGHDPDPGVLDDQVRLQSQPAEDPQNPTISLKQAFSEVFLIGAAVNRDQITGQDPAAMALVVRQFNALTPENTMKWERIHPLENQYDWTVPDTLVSFSQDNGLYLSGHVLVWHQQTPDWVFLDANGKPASRELLLARMEAHISAVVGRYRGKIQSWEVVNEALNEDGSLRVTPWRTIIGDDYIARAFEFAHRADPEAVLYYNDYNMYKPEKRAGAVKLVRQLQQQDAPIHGIGMQAHYGLGNPADLGQFEDSIVAFSELGVAVFITEMDVSILPFPEQEDWGADIAINLDLNNRFNPYSEGVPPEIEQQQLEYYVNIFRILLKHRDVIDRVTFWGVNNQQSWKNDWPMEGRTDYPLLFNRDNQPTQACYAIVDLAGAPQP